MHGEEWGGRTATNRSRTRRPEAGKVAAMPSIQRLPSVETGPVEGGGRGGASSAVGSAPGGRSRRQARRQWRTDAGVAAADS